MDRGGRSALRNVLPLSKTGTHNGAPGERKYHPGYFGAFLKDPDGNNVEAVYHGPAERSADSVVIRAKAL